jgi:hypothetical protein
VQRGRFSEAGRVLSANGVATKVTRRLENAPARVVDQPVFESILIVAQRIYPVRKRASFAFENRTRCQYLRGTPSNPVESAGPEVSA